MNRKIYASAAALILLTIARAEKAAVVMSPDHKVADIVRKDDAVTVSELKDMVHEVGEGDPNFIPRPAPIKEPAPTAPVTVQPSAPGAKTTIPAAPATTIDSKSETRPVLAKEISASPLPPVQASVEKASPAAAPVVSESPRVDPQPLLRSDRVIAMDLFGNADVKEQPVMQPLVVDDADFQPLLHPDDKGIVIMPGQVRGSSDGTPNPWEVRLTKTRPIQEVKMRFGGIVLGNRPTAMINGKPYSAKENIGSFALVRLNPRSLIVERDGVFIQVPRGNEITIRIPQ